MEIITPDTKSINVISRLETSPDGISLLPDGSIPDIDRGYIVSVTNNIVKEVTPTVVNTVVSQIKHSGIASLIGGWYSAATEQFFVDASAIVDELGQAKQIARQFGQEAIFDIGMNDCIYLN